MDGSVYMKDYFQEFHRLKHKTRDDALLANVIVEMKQKKDKEERRNRIEKTKEYYLKVKKKNRQNRKSMISAAYYRDIQEQN